jgi:hypothetical protein
VLSVLTIFIPWIVSMPADMKLALENSPTKDIFNPVLSDIRDKDRIEMKCLRNQWIQPTVMCGGGDDDGGGGGGSSSSSSSSSNSSSKVVALLVVVVVAAVLVVALLAVVLVVVA